MYFIRAKFLIELFDKISYVYLLLMKNTKKSSEFKTKSFFKCSLFGKNDFLLGKNIFSK
jgi:hypothetical protein